MKPSRSIENNLELSEERVSESLGVILESVPEGPIKEILKVAYNCTSALTGLRPHGNAAYMHYERNQHAVSALEYLKSQSANCANEDLHMVIEAAWRISLLVHYMKIRGEYPAATH